MNSKNWIGALALLFAAHTYAAEVSVSDAWARATVPGQEVGLVGMVITSQKDARLIAVSSSASASGEIHTMTMDDGVMKMRQIEYLALPEKEAVTLGPGGNHLMLINLKHALHAGDKVPLTLTVEFADKSTLKINSEALVRPLAASREHHRRP